MSGLAAGNHTTAADVPFLHLCDLFAVLFAELGVDVFVETGRAETDADGKEGVHLITLLGNLNQ